LTFTLFLVFAYSLDYCNKMSSSYHPNDIRSVGSKVRLIPTMADSNLSPSTHKICVMGHYSDEVDQQLFSFVDIQVTSGRGHAATSIDTLGSWITMGETTDISLADLDGNGEVLIGISSGSGSIMLLRLLVPRQPGVKAADIQILDLPNVDQKLLPWTIPHHSAASSIDIQRGNGTAVILSAGVDGSLAVIDVQSDPATVPLFKPTGPISYSSFISAKWAGLNSIASLSSSGQVDLWDTRKGPKPALSSPPQWGNVGEAHLPQAARTCRPQCLAVHPARPDLAAVGYSNGLVALWDLRMQVEPIVAVRAGLGGVTEVMFDPLGPASTPAFVFSTQDGVLAQASVGGPVGKDLNIVNVHDTSAPAINGFDLSGSDAVMVTDDQSLVYLQRQNL
jgi:WD40 repeat protein